MNIRFPFLPAFAMLEEVLVICLIGLVIWMAVSLVRGGGRGRAAEPPRDEDEALGRLLSQLDRMERRMENLETILMDKEKPTRERQER